MSRYPRMPMTDPRFTQRIRDVQAALGFTGVAVDGKIGHDTLSKIEDLVLPPLPMPTPVPPASPVPPVPPVPPVIIIPGTEIVLPKEGTDSLNRFYGTAKKNADYVTKFSFPSTHMRLYNREGAKLKDLTGDLYPDHSCHKAIKDRLEAAYRELFAVLGQERFEHEGWHVYSGCYNYRVKVGGSSLSTHSWAIAIDINDSENPYQQRTTTFSAAGIDIMEKHGFLSGGRAWGKDWMHFQAAIPIISSGSYYAVHGLPKHITAA